MPSAFLLPYLSLIQRLGKVPFPVSLTVNMLVGLAPGCIVHMTNTLLYHLDHHHLTVTVYKMNRMCTTLNRTVGSNDWFNVIINML